MRHVVRVFLAALALAGCAGDDDDTSPVAAADASSTPPTVPAAERLCAAGEPERTATVADDALTEISGLVVSASRPEVFWAHNDSGDAPRLFALGDDGATHAVVTLEGAEAIDWEDIARDANTLYVGDIGDNAKARSAIVVYDVTEPSLDSATAAATRHELHYPDGAHDAEALFVDARDRVLVVVTKDPAGRSGVYTTPLDRPGDLTLVRTLDLGVAQLVTAGDATDDVVALRTYGKVFVWPRADGRSLADTLGGEPCEAPAALEAQGEALAIDADGLGFTTVSEGSNPDVWSVTAAP